MTALGDEALYRSARKRLFALAYRMLGQVSEAEDMVQEAFVRWRAADSGAVADPLAYLLKITARLCLDHMKSARRRREIYVGEWLPEPLPDGGSSDDFQQQLPSGLKQSRPMA